jgi:pSer/pThr/pTyr-binding forkhead associated (FHA) protein/tetratricopeptide (TPR) repeat protein
LEAELSIGRAEDNALQLNDPKVSRYHARVVREGDNYILSDLGSANGTLVNGQRLKGPHPLQDGELVSIGDAELSFQEPAHVEEAIAEESPEVPVSPLPASETKPKRRGWVIAVALVVAVFILILGGVAIYGLLNSPQDMPDEVGQLSPTPETISTSEIPQSTVVSSASSATAIPNTPVASGVTPEVTDSEVAGLLLQAEALSQRSKIDEATIIYEELARQAPDDAEPEVGWAWALILDDEADQALVHARRAVGLDPTSVDAATVLARAYLETGDATSGRSWAEVAAQLDTKSSEAHAVLAEAYMNQARLEEAITAAELALVYDSQSANAHRIRGWLYQVADNDLGRAASELQRAAGLQPELWLRHHELGLLLSDAGDYATALQAFRNALDMHPEAATYTAMAGAYHMLGQNEEAESSARQALSAGAEDEEIHAIMAVILATQGQCDEALDYAEQALELDAGASLALDAKLICEEEQPRPTGTTSSSVRPGATPESTPGAPKPPAPPPAVSGRIVFPVWNRERGKYDTYVSNADGSERRLVVEEMHQPSFSPDGQWLAVNGERHEQMNLFIVRPDGGSLKEISKHLEDNRPAWSPRDGTLAFSSTMHGDKQSRVYVMDQVPFEGRQQEGRPLNFGPDDVRGESPAWTPDDRIVYKGCDSTVEPARCGLFVIPSGKGAQPATQLTEHREDAAPAVSPRPGDARIAFMSSRDGNWEIYVMNADGSGLKRLTNDAAHDGLPVWSPDGKSLAFVSNSGGSWAVWVMNSDGTRRSKLFDVGGGGLAFEWQNEQIGWGP